jgi:hypothetical protein
MTTVSLRESANITLDGSGNGTARVGPLSSREKWHPANVHVKANSNPVNESACDIFMGNDTSQSNFRDGTFSGSSGDQTDALNADVVNSGFYIWGVWSGGDAGVQATLTVTGTKEV